MLRPFGHCLPICLDLLTSRVCIPRCAREKYCPKVIGVFSDCNAVKSARDMRYEETTISHKEIEDNRQTYLASFKCVARLPCLQYGAVCPTVSHYVLPMSQWHQTSWVLQAMMLGTVRTRSAQVLFRRGTYETQVNVKSWYRHKTDWSHHAGYRVKCFALHIRVKLGDI